MEREQNEADDAEDEANLQEALTIQSKVVKVVVDKWFVDNALADFGQTDFGQIYWCFSAALTCG